MSVYTEEAHAAARVRLAMWTAAMGGQRRAGEKLGLCQSALSAIIRGVRPPARWDCAKLEELTGIPAWSWHPPKPRFTRRKKMTVAERFASKLTPAANGCIEYTGQRDRKGYGRFWDGAEKVLAHRHAWLTARKPIPDGLFVCHKCDNPPCCNPNHLFLGTNLVNVRDAVEKGRPRGAQISPRRGEANNRAKLTEAQVIEIRRRLREPRYHGYLADLASDFGVTRNAVASIRDGATWQHVEVA